MQYLRTIVNLFVLLLTSSIVFAMDLNPEFIELQQSSKPNQTQQSSTPAQEIEEAPAPKIQTEVKSPEVATEPAVNPLAPTTSLRPQPRPQTTAKPQTSAPIASSDYNLKSLGIKANAGESLSTLKSCGSLKMILGPKKGRTNPKCSDVKIANSFAPLLMKNMSLCIAEGAAAAGINKTIRSSDVYNADAFSKKKVAGSSRWSMHSTGRAFDVYQIDVKFTDGTTLNTPMTIGSKNKPFYKTFNSCWRRLNNGCDGKLRGLIDCNNSNHRDHVHLSMPFCPSKAGYSST